MSLLTPPTYEPGAMFYGDVDVLAGLDPSNGDGTIYIRDGGLYVSSLTDLNETTISTNDGPFTVNGSNNILFNVTNAITFDATATSNFSTTTGTLTLSSTDSTGGKVLISSAGLGADSVKILSSNATSGQINIQSSGGSTTIAPILIQSTDTTNGYVNITAAGNFAASNPAIKLLASNTTSGQILLSSAGNTSASPAVKINATGTTGGNISVIAAGDGTGSVPAISLSATDSTAGKIMIETAGAGVDSIKINTTNGGIQITGQKETLIDTIDTTNGVVIASSPLVPVTIGSTGSLTTINGNLTVKGDTIKQDTITLTVEDNVVILNSGSAVSQVDAGIAIRRYQTPNDTPSGDVIGTPNPIQESGAFQAGSATPGTLVLALFASSVNNFYNGWWIKVTSGTGINQVRRIKSYVGSTKTATIYVTADNVSPIPGPSFVDGLDLSTAPAAADTYDLFCASYEATYYDEATHQWSFSSIANPDEDGITPNNIQQSTSIDCGKLSVSPQEYRNAFVSASGTTLTVTLKGHGMSTGYIVYASASNALTPALTSGNFVVQSVTTNTFTITAAASTVSTTASSLMITILNSSIVQANVIEPYSPGFPIAIPGLSLIETIIIPKTSTSLFTVTNTQTYGLYIVMVADYTITTGANSIFLAAGSGTGGNIQRVAVNQGTDNQRISATWTTGNKIQIFHSPAGSGAGNYTYRVRIFSAL